MLLRRQKILIEQKNIGFRYRGDTNKQATNISGDGTQLTAAVDPLQQVVPGQQGTDSTGFRLVLFDRDSVTAYDITQIGFDSAFDCLARFKLNQQLPALMRDDLARGVSVVEVSGVLGGLNSVLLLVAQSALGYNRMKTVKIERPLMCLTCTAGGNCFEVIDANRRRWV